MKQEILPMKTNQTQMLKMQKTLKLVPRQQLTSFDKSGSEKVQLSRWDFGASSFWCKIL